jgi:hypothetical protein
MLRVSMLEAVIAPSGMPTPLRNPAILYRSRKLMFRVFAHPADSSTASPVHDFSFTAPRTSTGSLNEFQKARASYSLRLKRMRLVLNP